MSGVQPSCGPLLPSLHHILRMLFMSLIAEGDSHVCSGSLKDMAVACAAEHCSSNNDSLCSTQRAKYVWLLSHRSRNAAPWYTSTCRFQAVGQVQLQAQTAL